MNAMLRRALAILLAVVGTSCLLPMAAAYRYGEPVGLLGFGVPLAASWLVAGYLLLADRGKFGVMAGGNVFILVGCAWIAISLFGAVPLCLCGHYGVVDALFESASGFTTTGSTVVADVERLPYCVNLWRCQMHWLGGMGFIGLVVALLPMLGESGFRIVLAESTGPEKGKLTSRVRDTARLLWFIYVALTALQCLLLHLAGMGWFDALCHAFSTLGTGGFSTRNGSIAAFASPAVEWVCVVFMLLAAVNFGIYFLLVAGRWREAWENSELRGFLYITLVSVAAVTLVEAGSLGSFSTALRHAAFQVAAVISTTGFMSSDYMTWRPTAQLVLLLLFFTGGCSGSTAGGIKVIRWVALAKGLCKDVLQLIHPHGVFVLRINGQPAKSGLVAMIGSFVFVYFLFVFITALVGTLCGQDVHTAFTAALAMVGNVGTAFGTQGPTANWGGIPTALKLWYCVAMLAGRLEVYTLLILVGQSVALKRNS